ncbi:MAG: DUF2283 domain-containing protein [Alphaproteobacteria bacterium]|nr:DUF2283 domain-containing protein [Alphaproteobacteria bacterium]MBU6473245.1 DUF2283 domain-containing protein [Alphaproteobacteria bacterium]MDE2011429.1 DUF2283 domain-containing protein [Alphaproteobacteria bacterium]MDE2071820.1 DUF2283 domain-containing protein [Alphaproteobacteria bacterium]
MKVNFDQDTDALYVRFSDSEISETVEVRPGVMLDYDAKGRIVGLEILDATKNLADANLKQLALEVA